METKTATSQESPTAGKGGETTANATRTAATSSTHDLTSSAITGLLASEFARTAPADDPAPTADGEEVQPAADGENVSPTGDTPETPELEAGAESPDDQTAAGDLPAEVLAQVQAWEEAGGALPPALQGIVDGRIKRELNKVKDLESRAAAAEAETERLTAELTAKGGSVPPVTDTVQQFNAKVEISKKFLKDARPYVGGYATDEQKEHMEKFMTAQNLDGNSFRQYVDEINDWLTTDAPQERDRIAAFREQEQTVEPVVAQRFPTLGQKDSAEAKFAAEILRITPELRQRTSGHKLAVAAYVLGKIATEHLLAASPTGDLVAQLKSALAKAAPIPNKAANGKPTALPGKSPVRTPTGSPLAAARTTNGKTALLDQQSERLRTEPTAENVFESLKIALR